MESDLREAFKIFDRDKDGFVDISEFKQVDPLLILIQKMILILILNVIPILILILILMAKTTFLILPNLSLPPLNSLETAAICF